MFRRGRCSTSCRFADSRKEGDIDFLYTETTSRGANVLTGAGARVVGHISRFVLPIGAGRIASNLAVRTYLRLRQRRLGAARFHATQHAAEHFFLGAIDPPLGASDRSAASTVSIFTADASKDTQLRWTIGSWRRVRMGKQSRWCAVRNRADTHGSRSSTGRSRIGAPPWSWRWWMSSEKSAAAPFRFTRSPTRVADELRRAGFVERESQPFVALALSEKGEHALTDMRKWQITDVDLDS